MLGECDTDKEDQNGDGDEGGDISVGSVREPGQEFVVETEEKSVILSPGAQGASVPANWSKAKGQICKTSDAPSKDCTLHRNRRRVYSCYSSSALGPTLVAG